MKRSARPYRRFAARVRPRHARVARLAAYVHGGFTALGDGLVVAGINLATNCEQPLRRGGDHWLMISDFDHLAWHIKNLYLELTF